MGIRIETQPMVKMKIFISILGLVFIPVIAVVTRGIALRQKERGGERKEEN